MLHFVDWTTLNVLKDVDVSRIAHPDLEERGICRVTRSPAVHILQCR